MDLLVLFICYYTFIAIIFTGHVIEGLLSIAVFSLFWGPHIKGRIKILRTIYAVNNKKMLEFDTCDKEMRTNLIVNAFKDLGYNVTVMEEEMYESILILTLRGTPRTLVYIRHSINRTGIQTLHSATLAAEAGSCKRILIITNGVFSDKAYHFAKQKNIILWNREKLNKKLFGKHKHMIAEDVLPERKTKAV